MSEFQKVLVVDDGARNGEHALSAELAELGFASVTTSLEATDDVLEMIPPPAAILLQLPKPSQTTNYNQFMELAARLKAKKDMSGIPIILVESPFGTAGGGYASALRHELRTGALNKPEL
jgi:PleD family two-component response regulator